MTKANINSMEMQLSSQMATMRVAGAMEKSADMMKVFLGAWDVGFFVSTRRVTTMRLAGETEKSREKSWRSGAHQTEHECPINSKHLRAADIEHEGRTLNHGLLRGSNPKPWSFTLKPKP